MGDKGTELDSTWQGHGRKHSHLDLISLGILLCAELRSGMCPQKVQKIFLYLSFELTVNVHKDHSWNFD